MRRYGYGTIIQVLLEHFYKHYTSIDIPHNHDDLCNLCNLNNSCNLFNPCNPYNVLNACNFVLGLVFRSDAAATVMQGDIEMGFGGCETRRVGETMEDQPWARLVGAMIPPT